MNWIDFSILFVLILAFLNGYRRGAFKEISTFLGLILSIIFTINNADWLVGQLHGKFNFSPTILYVICYALVMAACIAILKLLGHFFYQMVKIAPLKVPNKITGGVFGIIKGGVVLSLVLLLFLFPTPFRSIDTAIETSVMARPIRGFVPVIYNNTGVMHPRSEQFLVEVNKGIILPSGSFVASNDTTSASGAQLGVSEDDAKTLNRLNQYFNGAKKQ
jgi:membrane protein required for colicin V production